MKTTTYALKLSAVSMVLFACSSAKEPAPEKVESAAQYIESTCAHPICAAGEALASTCDPCATQVCGADPYCCSTSWDATCVGEVTSICGQGCTAPPPPPPDGGGGDTCAHPVCAVGGPLVSTCNTCATTLCAQDPYCCAVAWDATCVGEVISICGQACN